LVDDYYFEVRFGAVMILKQQGRKKTSEKSVNLARNEVGLRRRRRAQSERWRNVRTSASGGGGGC
jgi:hypothetical protein